jgi:hypothetical protein
LESPKSLDNPNVRSRRYARWTIFNFSGAARCLEGCLNMDADNAQPSLIEKEWTPANLKCWPAHCPAVHELKDGRLLIIGKKTSSQLAEEIRSRVGDDEHAVIIDREFFSELFPTKG